MARPKKRKKGARSKPVQKAPKTVDDVTAADIRPSQEALHPELAVKKSKFTKHQILIFLIILVAPIASISTMFVTSSVSCPMGADSLGCSTSYGFPFESAVRATTASAQLQYDVLGIVYNVLSWFIITTTLVLVLDKFYTLGMKQMGMSQ